MKQNLIAVFIIFASLTTNFANAKTFSDISQASPFFNAVNYLSSQNIINGYSDGTFKPYSSINRAELLKLLMSGTDTEITKPESNCFQDVPYTKWYSPYICTALQKEIIIGYADETFKPEQNINKVETLKIIGKIYNWNLEEKSGKLFSDTIEDQWYTPYLTYAQNHNLLPETSTTYKPENDMIRGNIAEILYRYLIASDGIFDPTSTPEIIENTKEISETPTSTATMASTEGEITIILKWADKESDFDAHLIEPSGETLYFLHKRSSNMKNYMETKEQTEIIHLLKLEKGNYHFSVVNFSKTKSFKDAKVTIEVYDKNGLADIYYAPESMEETWEIFDLTNEGEIKPI